MDNGTRLCRACGIAKPDAQFGLIGPGKRRGTCNACRWKRRGVTLAERECVGCGAGFRPKDAKYTSYCTSLCAIRHQQEQSWVGRFSPAPWHECSVCGEGFYARKARAACSRSCLLRKARESGRAEHPSITDECSECGESFTYTRYNHGRVVCSERCNRLRAKRLNPDAWAARRSRQRAIRRGRMMTHDAEMIIPRVVFIRDRWCCWICASPVLRSKRAPHPLSPTIDHVLPLALGGTHRYDNVRCAHFLCNARRGAAPPPQGQNSRA